jgi:hypothetical protein
MKNGRTSEDIDEDELEPLEEYKLIITEDWWCRVSAITNK